MKIIRRIGFPFFHQPRVTLPPPGLMYCSSCGKLTDEWEYCRFCGHWPRWKRGTDEAVTPIQQAINCKNCGNAYNAELDTCPHCGNVPRVSVVHRESCYTPCGPLDLDECEIACPDPDDWEDEEC